MSYANFDIQPSPDNYYSPSRILILQVLCVNGIIPLQMLTVTKYFGKLVEASLLLFQRLVDETQMPKPQLGIQRYLYIDLKMF